MSYEYKNTDLYQQYNYLRVANKKERMLFENTILMDMSKIQNTNVNTFNKFSNKLDSHYVNYNNISNNIGPKCIDNCIIINSSNANTKHKDIINYNNSKINLNIIKNKSNSVIDNNTERGINYEKKRSIYITNRDNNVYKLYDHFPNKLKLSIPNLKYDIENNKPILDKQNILADNICTYKNNKISSHEKNAINNYKNTNNKEYSKICNENVLGINQIDSNINNYQNKNCNNVNKLHNYKNNIIHKNKNINYESKFLINENLLEKNGLQSKENRRSFNNPYLYKELLRKKQDIEIKPYSNNSLLKVNELNSKNNLLNQEKSKTPFSNKIPFNSSDNYMSYNSENVSNLCNYKYNLKENIPNYNNTFQNQTNKEILFNSRYQNIQNYYDKLNNNFKTNNINRKPFDSNIAFNINN